MTRRAITHPLQHIHVVHFGLYQYHVVDKQNRTHGPPHHRVTNTVLHNGDSHPFFSDTPFLLAYPAIL
jgi:hypothetical protein